MVSHPVGRLVDSSLTVETSTGVEIDIRTAGVCVRGIARIIDDAIRLVLMVAVIAILTPLGGFGEGLAFVGVFIVWWFYGVIFEVVNDGVTPGKYFMGLRAVNADGTPIGFVNSAIRSVLLFVDLLPFGYLTGIITMAISGSQQRVGDIVAGTVVVYNQPRKVRKPESTNQHVPVPAHLTTEERMLFLSYQERIRDLSPERAIELAETLTPVLGVSGGRAVSSILGIADGIRRGV